MNTRRYAELISDKTYRAIFDAADDAIFLHNCHDGSIVDVNQRMCEMYGYERDEALRLTVGDLSSGTAPYTKERALELIREVSRGKPKLFEWLARRKNGRLFWVEVNLKKITIDEKDWLLAIVRDITKRKQREKALEDSEKKYRLLAENVRDVIWTMDTRFRYTYVSPSVKYLRGYDVEEVMKQRLQDVLTPSSLVLVKELIEEEYSKKETIFANHSWSKTLELELKRKDGSSVWTEINVSLIRDSDGQIKGFLGVTRDISERKRAETEIIRLASVIEQASESIAITDTRGKIIYVNPFFEKTSGYNKEELLGKNFCTLISQDIKEAGIHKLWETISHGNLWKGTLVNKRRDGTTYHENVIVFPIRNKIGKVINYAAIKRDITEEVKAAEALRQSERKYSALVENSLTGIYISNKEGRILYANCKFAEIFGYSKQELIGIPKSRLIHPEFRKMVEDIRYKRLAGTNVPLSYEVAGVKKTGEMIWVKMRNTCICYNGEQAILGNVVEITKRRKMEEALRRSESELKMLYSKLLMAQEEERKRIAWELHDGLGQSLTAIKFGIENVLELIEKKKSTMATRTLQNMVLMVQNAIDEVRKTSMGLRPSMLDDLGIVATISWLCREFNKIHTDIQIERKINLRETEIPEILKTNIFRVIQEALNNIAKHSKANYVSIELEQNDREIKLLIKDNGKGFDVNKTRLKGNLRGGFGLASMKERTKFLKGDFHIESVINKGTTIVCTWPLH